MLKIIADNQMTRRRRLHYILDDHENLLFTAPKFGDCLEWLWNNEHRKVIVEGEKGTYTLNLIREEG